MAKKASGASSLAPVFARNLTLIGDDVVHAEFDRMLTEARTALVLQGRFVFFTTLIMSMPVRYTNDVATAAVDGKFIYINPQGCIARGHKPSTLMALLAHEVLHPALRHLTRRIVLPQEHWNLANLAMDMAINIMLHDAGFDTSLFFTQPDMRYQNMTWEEIFEQMLRSAPPISQENNDLVIPMGHSQDGDEGSDVATASVTHQAQNVEWAQRLIQAQQNAMARNARVPDFVDQALKSFESSQTPWYMLLRQLIQPTAFDMPQWNPGDSRYRVHGFRVPASTRTRYKSIVVAVDTSGSVISEDMLTAFAGELTAIISTVKAADTHVIYCDSQVRHVETFSYADSIQLHPKGGGGTDFDPPFEWVEQNGIDCGVLIYLTDGWSETPTVEKPQYPVIWAVSTDHYAHLEDFGHILRLPD